MASLPFAEKGGEFAKDGVSSSAQNRGRTTDEMGRGWTANTGVCTVL
jgi:hypothetical protein